MFTVMPCWDACWKSLEPKADHTSSVPASHVVSIIIADCCMWNIKRHHLLIRFFCRRAFICRRNLPNTKENENATSLLASRKRKTMATDFCRLYHQKISTLWDQFFYLIKTRNAHLICLLALCHQVHCSIKIGCIYILEKTRHLLKVQWSFQKQ